MGGGVYRLPSFYMVVEASDSFFVFHTEDVLARPLVGLTPPADGTARYSLQAVVCRTPASTRIPSNLLAINSNTF